MAIELVLQDRLAKTLSAHNIGKFFINFPVGEKVIARPNIMIEECSRHPAGFLIEMGAFSYVVGKHHSSIVKMKIGRYCSIADGAEVIDGHHPISAVTTSPYIYGPAYREGKISEKYLYTGPKPTEFGSYGNVIVGNDVWIGTHSTIKAGVKIGDGAVVAGGSNVVKDVPPYAIVGGNPATIIRYRFSQDLIDRFLNLSWWNLNPDTFRHYDMTNPADFCARLEDHVASQDVQPFTPATIKIGAQGEFSVSKNSNA